MICTIFRRILTFDMQFHKAAIPQVTLNNIVQCYKEGNKNIRESVYQKHATIGK